MPLKFRDHAWFAAYAPFEDPRIAVIVLVEHGGFGAAAAAPIAKQVFEKFFQLEASSPRKSPTRSRRRQMMIDRRLLIHFDWTLLAIVPSSLPRSGS